MPSDKTTSYDSNVIIDDPVGTALDPGPYFGFERVDPAVQSLGPRIIPLSTDPNGVLVAPAGSIALLSTGDLKVNTDGGTTWVSAGGGGGGCTSTTIDIDFESWAPNDFLTTPVAVRDGITWTVESAVTGTVIAADGTAFKVQPTAASTSFTPTGISCDLSLLFPTLGVTDRIVVQEYLQSDAVPGGGLVCGGGIYLFVPAGFDYFRHTTQVGENFGIALPGDIETSNECVSGDGAYNEYGYEPEVLGQSLLSLNGLVVGYNDQFWTGAFPVVTAMSPSFTTCIGYVNFAGAEIYKYPVNSKLIFAAYSNQGAQTYTFRKARITHIPACPVPP